MMCEFYDLSVILKSATEKQYYKFQLYLRKIIFETNTTSEHQSVFQITKGKSQNINKHIGKACLDIIIKDGANPQIKIDQ